MRDDYALAQFRAMCERGEVRWYYREDGGFEARIKEFRIRLYGSETSNIMLKISKWPYSYAIHEPRPPFDEVPAGKFVNWVRKILGKTKANKALSADEQKNKAIWSDLNFILKHAGEQCREREKQEGYREKMKNDLLGGLLKI